MGVVYYANYFVWFEVGADRSAAVARLELPRDGGGRRLAAGHRSALRVSPAGPLRRRARDADDGPDDVAGRGWSSPTRSSGRADGALPATGRTVHATLDPTGGPCRLPRRESRRRSHEGAGDRRGRVHRIPLADGAARPRRGRRSGSTASPTTTRGRSRKRTWRGNGGRPGFRFVESTLQDADLPSLLDGARTCSTWRRRPACARAGAATSGSTPTTTSTRRSGCSRPASDARCTGSSTRRAHRSTATTSHPDARGRAAAAGVAVRRDQAGGRAALLPLSREPRVPTTSLRYFTVYGPRQRPDMAFHQFLSAALRGEPITLYGDGEQTRDFTFVADAVAATVAAGDRGVPGRAYNIGGGSRVSINQVFDIIGRVTGKPLEIRREPARKATCATRSRIRRGPGPISASRRRSRSRKAWRPNINGCHHIRARADRAARMMKAAVLIRQAGCSAAWRRSCLAAAAPRGAGGPPWHGRA